MNVTRLRAIMQRYKEAGVLLVGAYLVGHHLWTKRRLALLTTPATLLILACWLVGILRGPHLAAKRPEAPSPSAVPHLDSATSDYLPKHPLLRQATKILALDADYLTHFWVSVDRLLLITGPKPPRTDDVVEMVAHGMHRQATLLNIRTGRRRKMRGLTHVFNQMYSTPDSFETSPGGEWLSWINRETPDGWPTPAVARWDGSGFQQWDLDKFSNIYWLDDHRWVEEQTRTYDETKAPKEIIVHDAERQKTSSLKLKSKAGQKLLHAHFASCEHGFDSDSYPSRTRNVTIYEKRSDADEDDAPPLHTYTIRMPAGADVRQIIVAPKTRRVLYVLRFRQVAGGSQVQPKYGVFDLWSSRLDGSDLKELGYVETGELDYSEDEDPMTAQNIIHLEWLPDGKQFSFIYRKHLYRATAY